MELRHLRYFVTLAKELHFGRAANALHISQPPLSMQIRDLEKEVGVELFSRTKRSVSLTQAGGAFLHEAKNILSRVDHAKTVAVQAARGEVGNLVIGFISVADYNLLPSVLREFRREYPLVSLNLREATTDIQVVDLINGVIDVGFILPPINSASIETRAVLKEPLIVALPEKHLLAKSGKKVSIKNLIDVPFIMTPRQHAPGLYDDILLLCKRHGFAPAIAQEAIQMQTIVSLVSAEMGIALIPKSIENLKRPGVVYREIIEPSPLSEIHIAWNALNDSPAARLFIEIVKEFGRIKE